MRNVTPFITVSKGIKHSGANLIRELKCSNTENQKTLMKETKEDTNKINILFK